MSITVSLPMTQLAAHLRTEIEHGRDGLRLDDRVGEKPVQFIDHLTLTIDRALRRLGTKYRADLDVIESDGKLSRAYLLLDDGAATGSVVLNWTTKQLKVAGSGTVALFGVNARRRVADALVQAAAGALAVG